jgi:small subunit ribosomal protein S1
MIEAFVLGFGSGEIRLTTKLGKSGMSADLLYTAFEGGIPVEGIVSEIVKGGYRVLVSGTRAFCPLSQIDIKNSVPEDHIQKKYTFKITEYKENGRNIIVSRRALLEEEREKGLAELKASLKVGAVVEGPVSSVADFGIFVSLGGVEGLVPRSELSWGRDVRIEDFHVGKTVSAKVVSIDWAARRIGLSIKQTLEEPWGHIAKYSEGNTCVAKIVNIIGGGAFAELEPGIEGYIPISKMSVTKRINKVQDVLSIGDMVNVRIDRISALDRKISLSLETGEVDPWAGGQNKIEGSIVTAVIESSKSVGVSVRLENGMAGFVPRKELLHSGDVSQKYATGKEVTLLVKEVDPASRRLILSETGVDAKRERDEYAQFARENTEDSPESGTLGALLKNQFADIQKKIQK